MRKKLALRTCAARTGGVVRPRSRCRIYDRDQDLTQPSPISYSTKTTRGVVLFRLAASI